jgi:hypothetical protein
MGIELFKGKDCEGNPKLYKLFLESEDKEIKVTPEFIEELRKEAKKQKAEEENQARLVQAVAQTSLSVKDFELEDLPEGFEVFDEEEDD